jgi:hypothetical protein
MTENKGLLSGGLGMVGRNKRYIVWFFVLNAMLAWFGAAAFSNQAHDLLDHSLHADQMLHGLSVGVLIEMFSRPEFGPITGARASSVDFSLLFLLLTAVFLPGVLQGYASTYRLPREDFFRACGRNLWRFIRLMIVAGIVMGIAAGILFGIRGPLLKLAEKSTNELLPFYVSMASLIVIFLVMATLRIWFDLAQTDVVLSDQRAVRRSIGLGFRHMRRNLGSLLTSYVVTAIVAALVLVVGIWVWMKFVPPASVGGAILVSQLTLLVLLIPRFWQRGVVVTYYLQNMVVPVAAQSFTAVPVIATPVVAAAPVVIAPVSPVIPDVPPEPPGS